jgi:hypothetical protein
MPQLLSSSDGPVARCTLCGKPGSGPCARCRAIVCADCVVLTEGASPFAVCLRCAERGGTSLRRAWLGLLGWVGVLVIALAAVAALLLLAR